MMAALGKPSLESDYQVDENHDGADEPLLPHNAQAATRESYRDLGRPALAKLVLLFVCTLVLIFESGNAIRTAPLIAVYQEKLCAEAGLQRESTDIRVPCSKVPEVERELAYILGVAQFLECVPMLLLSGLYGSLADRYGRRPILLLGYLGMILSAAWVTGIAYIAPTIPLRWVWVGPLFTTIGGGASVPISILMTSAADMVAAEQKVTGFAYVHATALVAVMLGAFASSLLMPRVGNFVPLLIGIGLNSLCLLLSTLLPNTQQATQSPPKSPLEGSGVISTLASGSQTADIRDDTILPKTQSSRAGAIVQSFRDLSQIPGVFPLLFAGFVSMLGQEVQILVLQYMPSRFGISLAEANLFNAMSSGINLLILLVVLPLSSTLLLRKRIAVFSKDKILAHIFGLIFITGAAILGLASVLPVAVLGLAVYSFGIGLSSLLRSIIVELFPPEDAAFATTLMSTVKSVGASLSGPVYSAAFALSLDKDNLMRGLPFFVSAGCFVLVECALALVRPPARTGTRVQNQP